MSPARQQSEKLFRDGFPVKLEERTPDSYGMRRELLELARDPEQLTLLWSMSHGSGVKRRAGDAGFQDQRTRQGAPVLGDKLLTEDLVAKGPFLPGGFWFLFACFGVGTPSWSAYLAWLKALVESGRYPSEVLRTLPRENESAFIAATPKAALANPEGPLAVLGHIDLAWSCSYDPLEGSGTRGWKRFLKVPEKLADREEPWRAGAAVAAFLGDLNQINKKLTEEYAQEADARLANRPSPIDPTRRGLLWMLRQDLGGYLLLGDPAVRLPLASKEEEPEEARHARLFPGFTRPDEDEREEGKPSVEVMVKAVLDTLEGEKGPKDIAGEAGVTRDEVNRWVEAYKKAGEAAMAELLRGRSR